ncbi:MAG: CAP domain-containing protein [Rubellimicrobium sp.]|nr:CAP domain-containing protein [Rubellimicrobium sp.]
MRPIAALLALGLTALLAGCDEGGTGQGAAVTRMPALAAPAAAAAADPGAAQSVEAALNAFRTAEGLAPARANPQLAAAARLHAEDMAQNGYFSHTSRDGRSYMQRIAAQGVRSCYPVENIAWGQRDAARAMAEWQVSPGHRENMLVPGRVEYGFGRAGTVSVLILARFC